MIWWLLIPISVLGVLFLFSWWILDGIEKDDEFMKYFGPPKEDGEE